MNIKWEEKITEVMRVDPIFWALNSSELSNKILTTPWNLPTFCPPSIGFVAHPQTYLGSNRIVSATAAGEISPFRAAAKEREEDEFITRFSSDRHVSTSITIPPPDPP